MSNRITPVSDPVLAWMLRSKTGLQAGGEAAGHEVLATYRTRSGETPFALCRHGLIVAAGEDDRYIPYADVEDAGYYNIEMVKRSKGLSGDVFGPLTIKLVSGEFVDLPLEKRDGETSDLLIIAKIIHRRSVLLRRRSKGDETFVTD